MTEQIKQCRVCGDPINAHRLPMKECMKKAYNLPDDWPGDYNSYLALCMDKKYIGGWGGTASLGAASLWFTHMIEKLVTRTPAEDMARIILTDLAPYVAKTQTSLDTDVLDTKVPTKEEMPALFEEEGKDEIEEAHIIVDEDGEQVG